MTAGDRFSRAFEVVLFKVIHHVGSLFWRMYGACGESAARKYYGMQSQVEGGELYMVDRKTGRPIPEFDNRRKRV